LEKATMLSSLELVTRKMFVVGFMLVLVPIQCCWA